MTPTIGRVVRFFLGYMLTETKPRKIDPERPVYRPAEIVDVHPDGSVALHVKLRGEHDFRNVVPTPAGIIVTQDEARANLKLVENAKEGTDPGSWAWPSIPKAAATSTAVELRTTPEIEQLFADFKSDLTVALKELTDATGEIARIREETKAELRDVMERVKALDELEKKLEPKAMFDAMESVARDRYKIPAQERETELHTGPDGDAARIVEKAHTEEAAPSKVPEVDEALSPPVDVERAAS